MKPLTLLSFDSLAGLITGTFILSVWPFVQDWYGWSGPFFIYVGCVHITYGCFSGVLSLWLRRSGRISVLPVIVLIIANAAWTGQCFTQAWYMIDGVTALAIAHLIFEGLFVGVLAGVEAWIILPQLHKE